MSISLLTPSYSFWTLSRLHQYFTIAFSQHLLVNIRAGVIGYVRSDDYNIATHGGVGMEWWRISKIGLRTSIWSPQKLGCYTFTPELWITENLIFELELATIFPNCARHHPSFSNQNYPYFQRAYTSRFILTSLVFDAIVTGRESKLESLPGLRRGCE